MKIEVFQTSEGWRADPVQLSGSPPNGIGAHALEAVDDLTCKLLQLNKESGHLRQMRECGWPQVEIAIARMGKEAAEDSGTKSSLDEQVGGNHYKDMAIQPVEYIHKNGLGFCEGNVVKYISRWRQKGGVEDLKKARHFIDLIIEMESQCSKIP